MSTHRNNFTGFRIAGPLSTFPRSDFKSAESTQFNDFVIFQTALNFLKELIYDIVDIFSVDTNLLVDIFDDFRFGQFAACQNLTFHCLGQIPDGIIYSPWSELSIL